MSQVNWHSGSRDYQGFYIDLESELEVLAARQLAPVLGFVVDECWVGPIKDRGKAQELQTKIEDLVALWQVND